MVLAGCNGEESDDGSAGPGATKTTCEMTMTGALERSGGCFAYWHQISANADKEPYFAGGSYEGLGVLNIYQLQPSTGTFQVGEGRRSQGMITDVAGVGQQEWRIYENFPDAEDTGTYTVTITGVSDRGESNGVHSWDVDGSLEATFVAVTSTGATGEIELRMDF